MNTALYIARGIFFNHNQKSFTRPVRIIAILSISLGLAVMIISMAVVTGFQHEIREKVIGFGSHIQISNFDYNFSVESNPMSVEQGLVDAIRDIQGVRHIQVFATKTGMLRTVDDIHGVVLKGVDAEFDWTFFYSHLVGGRLPDISATERSDEVLISSVIARRLGLSAGEDVVMYFVQEPARIRRFTISGVYDTSIDELDRIFIFGDLRHVQRLNDWEGEQVGGIEVLLDNYQDISHVHRDILDVIPYHLDARTIRQLYPQIFDWLALLDMNVVVVLVLMLVVAAINMVTTLLISVLERTSLVGILKAIGASNKLVRRVFLYNAAFLISKGMIWGNLVGLLLSFLQARYGLITLPAESYYVSHVPINLDLTHVLLLNLGTFFICMSMLILPSMIVARISPVKAITFR